MIRHLQLSNWRAYGSVNVSFSSGTTFVVAPNGVGKTSLIMALAWGLYGDNAKAIKPNECVKAGTDQAQVKITLDLSDGAEMVVSRTVKKRGRPTAVFSIDGETIDADAARMLLVADFGVDLATAARLSLMLGGGHLDASRALDLESHLHRAFGIADLLTASEEARDLARGAERDRKALRATSKQRIDDRAQVEAEIATLDAELNERHSAAEAMQGALADADRARTEAADWVRYQTEVQAFHAEVLEIAERATPLVGRKIVTPTQPLLAELADDARTSLQQAANQASHELTEARAAALSAQNAIQLLEGERHICPTCLQPLNESALQVARTSHGNAIGETSDRAQSLEGVVADTSKRLEVTNRLMIDIRSLSEPKIPSSGASSEIDAANARYQSALDAIDGNNQSIGTIRSQLTTLRKKLNDDDDVARDRMRLTAAYRREGLASATAQALQVATNQLTTSRIEPIAAEVKWRWKQLFNDGGLELRPDGTITRMVAGQELPWDSLSGGERIWARLVTHLLVIESSTKLPFAWFDEPLEHLDPKLRRSVAGYLASATQSTGPRQLIVTTYEHSLAAQLAADTDSASIVYFR